MLWLILCELLLLQFLLIAFLFAALARIPWRWLRWTLWTISVLTLFLAGVVVLADSPSLAAIVRGLSVWEMMFTPAGGAPTRRVFWFGVGLGSFAFPLGCAIAAIFAKRQPPPAEKVTSWSPFQLAALAGIATVVVFVTVLFNDFLICRELAKVEESAKQRAVSLLGRAPPEEANAHVLYRRAARLAKQAVPVLEFPTEELPPNTPGWRRRVDYRLSPDEQQRWQDYFDTHREIVDLCARAAQCDQYVPVIEDDRPWDLDEEFDELKDLGRFLRSLGHFQLTAEKPAEAYATAALIRRTAEHLSRDRRMLVIVLAFDFEGMACGLVERAIDVRPPTAAEVQSLKQPGFEYRPALPRTVDWCEAEQLGRMASMYGSSGDFAEGAFLARLLYARDDMSATPIHYQYWRNVANDPYPHPDPDDVPKDVWPRGYARVGEGGGAMTMILLPAVFSLQDSAASADTNRRLADYALDLTLGLPETTEERLTESLERISAPLDPFDGATIRARPLSGGVVLYGVGRDQDDDNGERDGSYGDMAFYVGPEFRERRLVTD